MAPIRQSTARVPIPVAPRTQPAPLDDNDRQFLREQKDLETSLDKEQRVLEQIHSQEMAQAKAKANAQEVAQRHAAELQAQQEQRQRDEQQLQTRQQIRRQAAQASAADAQKLKTPAAEAGKPKKKIERTTTRSPSDRSDSVQRAGLARSRSFR